MTSRERILAATAREEVDHVPCCPSFNSLTPQQRAGHRYQFPWGPSQREQVEYCAHELGVDPVVSVGAGPICPRPGVSSRVSFDGRIIRKTWETPSGQLAASVAYNERWPHGLDIPFFSDFNIGHFVEPWMKSERDLACLQHILLPATTADQLADTRFEHAEAKSLSDRLQLATVAHVGMGLTGALQVFGAESLCLMTIDKPELVQGFLDLEHALTMRRLEIVLDLGVDLVDRNGFYETADFYGPEMLRRYLGKLIAREIGTVHQAGRKVGYTVHTGIMPILDYLAEYEFDAFLYIDTGFKGVDLAAIEAKLGRRASFWTGPSNTYHLWAEDPEVVRRSVRTVFEIFGRRGLVIAPCPSAHSIMPWANTLAMIDEWKRLRA
jgi:hypothetical protein